MGALRQLIRGVLDSSLLNQFFDETVAGASATSHPVSSRVEAVVGCAWERRPSGFPTGAAAATRQRGVDPGLRPSATIQKKGPPPRRGQIWPAEVELISLPPAGLKPVCMITHSPRCREFLLDPEKSMLAASDQVEALVESMAKGETVPYIDPALKRDILLLAGRMSGANMLRGTPVCKATVGLLTVVKSVQEEEGEDALRLVLRLVFDERVPNEVWRRPPWVPLAGPGALSSIDLSEAISEGAQPSLHSVSGDLPNYYYSLRLPIWFVQWFVLAGLTAGQLAQWLRERGTS